MSEAAYKQAINRICLVFVIVVLTIGALFALGLVLDYNKPPTKTVTKTVTKTIPFAVSEPSEATQQAPGSMTAAEFNSIVKGMHSTYVRNMFGRPPGNRGGDYQTWYPAVGGGRYVIHYKDDGDYHLIVTTKEHTS